MNLDRESLGELEIETLRSLKRDVHWALSAKENQQKIPVWQIEGYTGVTHAYMNFDSALKYVKDNIEECYRTGAKSYISEGYPSYMKLEGHAPRIVPRLYLPADLENEDEYYILDLKEYKQQESV